LAFSYWIDYLGFTTEGRLAAVLIIPSLGVPNWSVIYIINTTPSPHNQQKYDGLQEPTLWLSDYLQAVQILRGTRAIAMQSLQLHLTGAAQSWLNTLPNDSIRSWGELESQFARNFCSTYKRPASLEEIKSCVQRKDETLCSYIQWWSVIKNSAEDVSDEQAIDAFSAGLRRSDLVEAVGRTKPRIVSELMEVANRFTDGEDAYKNK
jgi:hypothetical protein